MKVRITVVVLNHRGGDRERRRETESYIETQRYMEGQGNKEKEVEKESVNIFFKETALDILKGTVQFRAKTRPNRLILTARASL